MRVNIEEYLVEFSRAVSFRSAAIVDDFATATLVTGRPSTGSVSMFCVFSVF